MASLWEGYNGQQSQGDDPSKPKQALHETFLQRQQRLGKMPNTANRTMYPQASNLAQGGGQSSPQTLSFTGQPQAQSQAAPQQQPQLGAPVPAAQPAQTTSTRYAGYSPDPNQAFAAANARYKAKHGVDIPETYKAKLAQFAGYSTGNLTPEQWDKAMWAVENFDPGTGHLPEYQAPGVGAPGIPGQAGPQQPNPAGFTPTPGWGVQTPPAYQPDTANLPEYQSTQFTQFQAPDQGGTTANMQSLLDQILLNPETLGATQTNQMKSAAKETALSQAEQLRGQAGSDLARRGFTGGGMDIAAGRAIDSNLINDLISSNREIDLQAAATNRADQLAALGAGDSFLNSQLQRATQGYGATLAGQEAQAGDRRAGSEFGLQRWQAGEEASRAANDSEFRNAQLQYDQMSDDRKQRLAEFLGVEAANLDRDQFAEMQSQFKTATGLDLLKFLENTRQFNASLGESGRQFNAQTGLQTAQLQQRGNESMMDWLARAYGL